MKDLPDISSNTTDNGFSSSAGSFAPVPKSSAITESASAVSGTHRTGKHTLKGSRPSAVIEHIRKHYTNYLGTVMPNAAFAGELSSNSVDKHRSHGGFVVLFQELLNNSIDEYIQGYGKVIEILCSPEVITLRDYGRGIVHNQLRTAIQEIGQQPKVNSKEIQFCEGLSGLGLKLANALSSRLLLRSYREQRFGEVESAEGVILRDRRGRCDKKDGVFIRLTPDPEIFGKMSIRTVELVEVLYKTAALYPGLEIRLNQNHVITQKGVGDLFQSLGQWRTYNYFYSARSLRGPNWQLGFAHLTDWRGNDGGFYNESLVQSFINGHTCAGGLAGGVHVRRLRDIFLSSLREVFPAKVPQVNAFGDKGIVLFWSLNLVKPEFQDAGRTHLVGAEHEVIPIVHECREKLLGLLQQDQELRARLEVLLEESESVDYQGEHSLWQSRVNGDLQQVEAQARKLNDLIQGSEDKYTALESGLSNALNFQQEWKDSSGQLAADLEKSKNDLKNLKKLQRAEQRHYRKEGEERLENLEKEKQEYQKLKEGLKQGQELVAKGVHNWNQLEKALNSAGNLQKQRDLEQEQILKSLRDTKASTEAEIGIAKQNIKLAEHRMIQRQEDYLKNFQDNANEQFDGVYEEIEGRKQELQSALDDSQKKAYDKLKELDNRCAQSLVKEEAKWEERLEQARKDREEEWKRSVEKRQQALENLDKYWREQDALLEGYRQRQEDFLQGWQNRLDEGRREAQLHQEAQNELLHNRKELQSFLKSQKAAREEQARRWQDWFDESQKDLGENQKLIDTQLTDQQKVQNAQQVEWEQRLKDQQREMEQIYTEKLESIEKLGVELERKATEGIEKRISDWFVHLENLGKESAQDLTEKQNLLRDQLHKLENELVLMQAEKDKLYDAWMQDLKEGKGEMSRQIAKRKEEWDQHQENLLKEFDHHLEHLKDKQTTQQQRIEEAQADQAQTLKQLQQFQRDADGRMNKLNNDLSNYTKELRTEIESSMKDLRGMAHHQLSQAEQNAQEQALLYHQNLLEREEAGQELLAQYEKRFNEKLGEQYKALDSWNDSFAERFARQKQNLTDNLNEFSQELKEKYQDNLSHDLEQWNKAFLARQNEKELQAAQEAERKRNEFWRQQREANAEDILQQRKEFQELHKQLQTTMERERERLNKELGYLRELTQQQEGTLENLSQSLTQDIEQHSERLKQELEENYRRFYEEILGNTRELHHINSNERKDIRNDLANMRRDIDDLNANLNLSGQTLANLQGALPDSLKLQESLDGIEKKEKLLRQIEKDVVQMQNTLNEHSQIGQKTSEQLAALLARRNELREMEQQMKGVLEMSGDLYQQRQSLEQQHQKVSLYQKQLDKLQNLYDESDNLLEIFGQRKDQLEEATTLLQNYTGNLSHLEQKIEVMQNELEPLELGFGKMQELQQELDQQQKQLQNTQKELLRVQQAFAELHTDSQGIDKMREWIAKTETRMGELSQDIKNNLRTVETIVRKNRSNERGGNSSTGKMDSDVRNTVIQLHKKKWTSSEIARATQLSVGEVELILEMLPTTVS